MRHSSAGTYAIPSRREVFGRNRLPPVKSKSFLGLVWDALQDKVMIMLSIAALVSLVIGIYQDLAGAKDHKAEVINGKLVATKPHWIEGLAILIAVVIVVLVGSVNDYRKEKQFQRLNAEKEDREIKVVRDGKVGLLSVYDLVVGDILQLEPGDIIPADGVLISGHKILCDESTATGESDAIKKRPIEDILAVQRAIPTHTDSIGSISALPSGSFEKKAIKSDPFLLSGAKVIEGVGKGVVINVGANSFNGKIMMNLRTDNAETPLQEKLGALATRISKLGGAAALLMFVVLLIHYFSQWRTVKDTPASQILARVIGIIITTITVIVVAVPEGLPLAVTLALAFATVRMLKDKNLVRVLSACETMGSASTICSDKTGTLTQNRMTVVAGTLGTTCQFLNGAQQSHSSTTSIPPIRRDQLKETIPASLLQLFAEGIAINSSAFESTDSSGETKLVGSKTEVALLEWIQFLGYCDIRDLRHRFSTAALWPFSSESKSMATLVKIDEGSYRLFVKGASEMVLDRCRQVVQTEGSGYTLLPLTEFYSGFQQRISEYAEESLRTIGLAYQDFTLSLEDQSFLRSADTETSQSFWDKRAAKSSDLVLLGVVGIEDPLREGVPEAVAACYRAGVTVRMVTGDNVLTAKSIAIKCGIYNEDSIIMEGPVFRKLRPEQMDAILPRLRVLARSSPEDKMRLVKRLKGLGHVVAVTGDGTNDAPALKAADIGFSMGIAGTEVAKEASSIILMDDNFSSIVKAIMWGRTVNDAVKKFLQFQLTVNITAVLLTFVSAISSDEETPVLRAVQLLWVNLIMDTLAALALATDPPVEDVLHRPPSPRNANLITSEMWKMILGQAIFQSAICLILFYYGPSFYNDNIDDNLEKSILHTLIFNSFVFLQIFNQLNCRRIDSGLNIFQGITRNYYFLVIFFLVIILQIVIVNFGGYVFETAPLDYMQWAISVLIGLLSLPIGVVIRLIPIDLFSSLRNQVHHPDNIPVSRVGRKGSTSYSPRKSFFTAAMVPSMVASSVGAGLIPHNEAPAQAWLNEGNGLSESPPSSKRNSAL
ncbi:plasma membrane calcium [Entomophthora muscae]|uniref:Plasma membrane calcium n=1 Tax=Entomophthora muscae TaxID=34485 RepID=A0ACC2RQZ0_9FUNG|nr:plasma membrane calcium [Entomophthora muscae]